MPTQQNDYTRFYGLQDTTSVRPNGTRHSNPWRSSYTSYRFDNINAGCDAGVLRIEYHIDQLRGRVLCCNLQVYEDRLDNRRLYNGYYAFGNPQAINKLMEMGRMIDHNEFETLGQIRRWYVDNILSLERPTHLHRERNLTTRRVGGGVDADNTYWNAMCLDSVCSYHYHKQFARNREFFSFAPANDRNKTIGFELELNSETEPSSTIIREFNSQMRKHVYFESDCSITGEGRGRSGEGKTYNYGCEVISLPHTEETLDALPLESVFTNLLANNICGSDSQLCGLHFHINRNAFGENNCEQYNNLRKIALFIMNNVEYFQKLFGRKSEHYCCYANGTEFADISNWLLPNHCNAINTSNSNTYEFRFARSTLNAERFRAIYKTLLHIAEKSKVLDYGNVSVADWLGDVSQVAKDYYAERRIFLDALSQ